MVDSAVKALTVNGEKEGIPNMFNLYITLALFITIICSPGATAEANQKEFVQSLLNTVSQHTYWQESYKYDVWDCTNMSTVLGQELQTFGADIKIETGKWLFTHGWHSMLLVKLDGEKCYIEPTGLFIYEPGDLEKRGWQHWANYKLSDAYICNNLDFRKPTNLDELLFR